ncbi:MAG TPA: shikimate kinase, partial [Chondromyces sp.]|nr:shikimate kinase [Chondromyces sp.]
ENREIMKKKGIVIFLNCDFPTIWERLIGDETRPLIKNKNKEEVEALYKKRLPFYLEGATAAVDTSGKTAEEAAMSVAQCLKELTDGETNTVQ